MTERERQAREAETDGPDEADAEHGGTAPRPVDEREVDEAVDTLGGETDITAG